MEVDFEGVKEMTFANYDFCEWMEYHSVHGGYSAKTAAGVCGLLCQGARSERERDHAEGRPQVGSRRRQSGPSTTDSGPFRPWCSGRRTITTWVVSDATERKALDAMHSNVVGL